MDQFPGDTGAAARESRRRVLQTAAALGAAAIIGDHQTTLAGRGWCRSDPLVLIGGILVDIFCTAHLTTLLRVTGPTQVVIKTPRGVPASLVLGGIGFGRGEIVRFEQSDALSRSDSGTDVEVNVSVPAPDGLEIGVEFAPRIVGILDPVRADGFSNQWITLNTHLSLDKLLGLLPLDTEQPGQEKRRSRGKRKGKGKRKRH
jgi:hypothetical protein